MKCSKTPFTWEKEKKCFQFIYDIPPMVRCILISDVKWDKYLRIYDSGSFPSCLPLKQENKHWRDWECQGIARSLKRVSNMEAKGDSKM